MEFVDGLEGFCTTGYDFKRSCEAIFRTLSSGGYDIVHVHNLLPMLLVSVIRRGISSKVIFTFHNTPDPPNRILGYFPNFELDKLIAENIVCQGEYDLLVAGSRFYYDWALKLGSSPTKTRHVYMGVDRGFFDQRLVKKKRIYRRKYGFAENDFIVTFPSRIIKRKGIFDLIEALPRLRDSVENLRLFLPAMYSPFDAEVAKDVLFMSKRLGVLDQVVIPAWHVDYQLMPTVYALSDLVVMPSYYEGLGLAILESLSMGIPVVATDVVGINEVVEDGVNGLLVEKQNPLQLSGAIMRVYKDRGLYGRLSEMGRKIVGNKFDIETQVYCLLDIYRDLLKR